MNKLLTALIVGAFAAGSAIAADTAKSTDATKSADTAKYKDCMKKDASGKETMDQACKDKVDKGAMAKGTEAISLSHMMTRSPPAAVTFANPHVS